MTIRTPPVSQRCPGTALVRPLGAVMWELRRAWATGRRVSLTLNGYGGRTRVEGVVRRVAATDAYAVVQGMHVPGEAILAVHWPSVVGGDATRIKPRGVGHAPPQAEELW